VRRNIQVLAPFSPVPSSPNRRLPASQLNESLSTAPVARRWPPQRLRKRSLPWWSAAGPAGPAAGARPVRALAAPWRFPPVPAGAAQVGGPFAIGALRIRSALLGILLDNSSGGQARGRAAVGLALAGGAGSGGDMPGPKLAEGAPRCAPRAQFGSPRVSRVGGGDGLGAGGRQQAVLDAPFGPAGHVGKSGASIANLTRLGVGRRNLPHGNRASVGCLPARRSKRGLGARSRPRERLAVLHTCAARLARPQRSEGREAARAVGEVEVPRSRSLSWLGAVKHCLGVNPIGRVTRGRGATSSHRPGPRTARRLGRLRQAGT